MQDKIAIASNRVTFASDRVVFSPAAAVDTVAAAANSVATDRVTVDRFKVAADRVEITTGVAVKEAMGRCGSSIFTNRMDHHFAFLFKFKEISSCIPIFEKYRTFPNWI